MHTHTAGASVCVTETDKTRNYICTVLTITTPQAESPTLQTGGMVAFLGL